MAGVSPKSQAIVGAVAAAGTLILVLILVVTIPLLSQQTSHVSTCPCNGPLFSLGNPLAGTCPSGGTISTRGCFSGDYVNNLTVESSTMTFGAVRFYVETPNGTALIASGDHSGFAILSLAGSVVAYYETSVGVMNMTSGWIYADGVNSSTPLTTIYTVVVDMGTMNPQGQGYTLVAVWTNSYSGVSPIALP
jgi:hypothetical protein